MLGNIAYACGNAAVLTWCDVKAAKKRRVPCVYVMYVDGDNKVARYKLNRKSAKILCARDASADHCVGKQVIINKKRVVVMNDAAYAAYRSVRKADDAKNCRGNDTSDSSDCSSDCDSD